MGWRVGDNDILMYFEGGIRGSFDSDTGDYTAFPPAPPANSHTYKSNSQKFLNQFRQIQSTTYLTKSGKKKHILDPYKIQKINKDWVVASEDKTALGINHEQLIALSIEAIKEQQNIIDSQAKTINEMKKLQDEVIARIQLLEQD